MGVKPILFNTEMTQAVLDGRKKATRRVMKPKHGGMLELHEDVSGEVKLCEECGSLCRGLVPPYQPGDILWVRETWAAGCMGGYIYKAGHEYADRLAELHQWKPSIHMPREAARLFLRVTDVRAERLLDMTVDDAIAEGINTDGIITSEGPIAYRVWNEMQELWESTIKPADRERYGWDANPWMWVIGLERCEKPKEWCK